MPDDRISAEAMALAEEFINLRLPVIEGARRIDALIARAFAYGWTKPERRVAERRSRALDTRGEDRRRTG